MHILPPNYFFPPNNTHTNTQTGKCDGGCDDGSDFFTFKSLLFQDLNFPKRKHPYFCFNLTVSFFSTQEKSFVSLSVTIIIINIINIVDIIIDSNSSIGPKKNSFSFGLKIASFVRLICQLSFQSISNVPSITIHSSIRLVEFILKVLDSNLLQHRINTTQHTHTRTHTYTHPFTPTHPP